MITTGREIRDGDWVLVRHSVGGSKEVIVARAGPGDDDRRALYNWSKRAGLSASTHTADTYPPQALVPWYPGFVESPDIVSLLGAQA